MKNPIEHLNNMIAQKEAEIARDQRALAALRTPEMQELARVNPDAAILLGSNSITMAVYLSANADEGIDISGVKGVLVSSDGYEIEVYRPLGEAADMEVYLEVHAYQKFSAEEEELLRGIGKLQRIDSSYDALMCG
jgi:hypothetical protein